MSVPPAAALPEELRIGSAEKGRRRSEEGGEGQELGVAKGWLAL
jgi:hypothetical protein